MKKNLNKLKNKEKFVNYQIFNGFFNYHWLSFSAKDLYEDNKNKNEKL